jgi:hypothetical protein
VDELLKDKIISASEAKDAKELLKSSPTIPEFLLAKQKIKFHIVRWTPPEVLRNAKVLRDKRTMTLEQAFSSPTISKMDVIGLVQRNRFTDFSVIYEFRNNGKVLNPDKIDIGQSLKEAILAYSAEGNWFKVLKRRYALAKYLNDVDTVKKLTPFLNSDLGRLYHIVGDIGTLTNLLDNFSGVPMDIVRYEIDQFRNRLSTIYSLQDYLKNESEVFGTINRILKLPQKKMVQPLSKLGDTLEKYLQDNTKAIMDGKMKGSGLPRIVGAGYEDLIKVVAYTNYGRTEAMLTDLQRRRRIAEERLDSALPVERGRLRAELRTIEDAEVALRRRMAASPDMPLNAKMKAREAKEKYEPRLKAIEAEEGDPYDYLVDRGNPRFSTPTVFKSSPLAPRDFEAETSAAYRHYKGKPTSELRRSQFHKALAAEAAERLRRGEF